MKNRISKILGIGLALVLALALVAGFALPVAASPGENEWQLFDYPAEGDLGDWFRDADIDAVGPMAKAINGDLYAYVELGNGGTYHLFKSDDEGRTWAETGYLDDTAGGPIVDMVCSSIDEDIIYVTDGNYVYKSSDAGDEFDFLAKDTLEEQLEVECGCVIGEQPITCLDVGYNDDETPYVYIGTRNHTGWDGTGAPCSNEDLAIPGSIYWIAEGTFGAVWTDVDLSCYGTGYEVFAIGCAPDFADNYEVYSVVSNSLTATLTFGATYTDCVPGDIGLAVVSTTSGDAGTLVSYDNTAKTWVVLMDDAGDLFDDGDEAITITAGTGAGTMDGVATIGKTHVVKGIGGGCPVEFAELFYDCDVNNPFGTQLASRIAFPDDFEDSETLFVGVVDVGTTACDTVVGEGGDVYSATSGLALDRNVAGINPTLGSCAGLAAVDITSLDIYGDYDEAALIAGAYCDTSVYRSEDGGWSWDVSEKDPTGERETYVLWYGDSALAATAGDECAVSLSCGEEVGEYWNQISLIATNIDRVQYLDHSPGYITESETMFMLTKYEVGTPDSYSLFRYDQTYWERVFWTESEAYGWMVLVSPDFNDTNAVYVANMAFEIWRTLDAGCSWKKLTFPCDPVTIASGVVIDEDTGIVGGVSTVYKTTRHGARPWDEYEVATTAGLVMSFDLEPGYEDPGTVLLGDSDSQVFISEDGGETWDLVGAGATTGCKAVLGTGDTSVVFDPEYATNDTIYAAAGDVIARCIIDPDEDWADQEWEEIGGYTGDEYWGIVAAGDTALYVGDRAQINDHGGVLRSLNPDTDDVDDVVFERIDNTELNSGSVLSGLLLTTDVSDDGCAENVLWAIDWYLHPEEVWVYEDTLAAPVVLDMPLDEQKLTTANSATLSWNELCGAGCYEVSLYQYCPECPEEEIPVTLDDFCPEGEGAHCTTAETCIVVGPGYFGPDKGLEAGTTYYWQVRVCKGEPYLSKWSEERTFSTALVAVPFAELCSPPCGDEDIILTPNFSWEAVDGATGYDIELATTETFTAGVIRGSSTVNAWVLSAPLDYATTYYWRVRAEKDGVYSGWTICIFTTMEEPAPPPPPPVVVEPTPPAPVVPAPIIEFPPTPNWVYAIIGIGTALVVVVIVLTVRRRPPA